jgi:hypothetical protein
MEPRSKPEVNQRILEDTLAPRVEELTLPATASFRDNGSGEPDNHKSKRLLDKKQELGNPHHIS